jgi:hypothetical protein
MIEIREKTIPELLLDEVSPQIANY